MYRVSAGVQGGRQGEGQGNAREEGARGQARLHDSAATKAMQPRHVHLNATTALPTAPTNRRRSPQ